LRYRCEDREGRELNTSTSTSASASTSADSNFTSETNIDSIDAQLNFHAHNTRDSINAVKTLVPGFPQVWTFVPSTKIQDRT
jgi:hypothetical protein